MSGRPTREESEALLDGEGSGPLHELLAAASGPAHREELAGEAAAVSAFVTAQRVGTVPVTAAAPPSRAARWRTPTGLAAALALALGTAGVAAGAAALVLHDQPPAVSVPATIPAARPDGSGRGSPLSDADRVAACGAWSTAGQTRGGDPAFADLISAAGGAPNVDGYCAAIPSGSPSPSGPLPEPAPGAAQPGPDATRTGTATGASSRAPADAGRGGGNGNGGNGNGGNGNGGNNGGGGGGNGSPGGGNSGNGSPGRAVGPPDTPPGQAGRDGGGANGRAVGPPDVPPGQSRRGGG
ncbi:hypothetical protein GCM10023200_23940 [Actinomycetospora chlora]|uniref:Uncharacterized protein n=1 Tax=Actinomycetospora chlora TaxID=663608 RepID=A0ABP9B271_9PSEU